MNGGWIKWPGKFSLPFWKNFLEGRKDWKLWKRAGMTEEGRPVRRPEHKNPAGRTKFIFITGGVLSSLGKGLAAASIGALLESRGLKVTLHKLDPYINV